MVVDVRGSSSPLMPWMMDCSGAQWVGGDRDRSLLGISTASQGIAYQGMLDKSASECTPPCPEAWLSRQQSACPSQHFNQPPSDAPLPPPQILTLPAYTFNRATLAGPLGEPACGTTKAAFTTSRGPARVVMRALHTAHHTSGSRS